MVPADAKLTVVFDLLGLGQWMLGHYQRNDEVVRQACEVCWDIIEDKRLRIIWVHHRGHQKDSSDFTRFNNMADKLCQPGPLVGGKVMASSLK